MEGCIVYSGMYDSSRDGITTNNLGDDQADVVAYALGMDYDGLIIRDIIRAVDFWNASPYTRRGILIQVPYDEHKAAAKRCVMRLMGEPSFNHSDRLRYGNRTVFFESIFQGDTVKYAPVLEGAPVFFVGSYAPSVIKALSQIESVPYPLHAAASNVVEGHVSFLDMVRVLKEDGWDEASIASALAYL